MVGETSYKNSSKSTCNNEKEFDDLFLEGVVFSKQIAQYNNSNCPGIKFFPKYILINIFTPIYFDIVYDI